MQRLVHGFLLTLLCGAIGGIVTGVAEGVAGKGAGGGLAVLFAMGLLVPVGMVLFGTVAVLAWMLPPEARPLQWWSKLRVANGSLYSSILSGGVILFLAMPLFYGATLFFMTKFNHAGLAAFTLLACLTILSVVLLLLAVRAQIFLVYLLQKFDLSSRLFFRPAVGGCLILLIWSVALLYGYATGDSGTGGWFSFMSLLKLDGLGAGPLVSLFALLFVSSFIFVLLQRFNLTVWMVATGVGVISVGFPLLAYSVSKGNPECVDRVNSVEGLAHVCGKVVRKIGDSDGDGHSRWFGGRDCNDNDNRIYPGAQEVPDNKIDEDCSGADLNLAQLAKRVKAQEPNSDELKEMVFPADLSVLLITVDALRTDAVGFMGQERPLTPNLDELFENGVIYENAYSISSYTSQSIPAMMTGKYPSELHRTDTHKMRVGLDETFAAERICTDGVVCGGIMSHFLFKPFNGWHQGFEYWEYTEGEPKDALNSALKITSPDVTRMAIKWMSAPENTKERFFMWVHYMDPHGDYLEHKRFKKFGSSRRDRYDHEVLYTDYHIGKLLEKFRALGLDKRTLVILTADHGESFNEHGRWLHGYELYEENIRVPFAIAGPNVPVKRIERPTSTIHLYATLLNIFGLEQSEGAHSQSLAADWVANQQVHQPYVVAEIDKNEKYDSRRVFIYNGWKLHVLEQTGTYRFYRLDDSGEKQSLESEYPAEFARTKDAYELFMATQLKRIPPVKYEKGSLTKMPQPAK